MNNYRKNITLSIVLALLVVIFAGALYFVFNFNMKSFAEMQDTLGEIAKVQNKTKQLRKLSPDLKKATLQLLEYALKKDDSLFFLDNLEKDIKKVATSSSIVSAQPKDLGSKGYSVLSLSIKGEGSLNDILNLLKILENIKYLSYIERVTVERLPKEDARWRAGILFTVFTR